MNKQRFFISGGAGVIGLELVQLLCERGATVFVGDLKQRPATFPAGVHYRQGDLNTLTREELERFAPDVFIHLAATFERSTETYGFWEENFRHNVRLSHHLMTIAKDLRSLKRVVFASSYLIYDRKLYEFPTPPDAATSLRETDPVSPRNLTGMAKLAHEVELRFIDDFRNNAFTTVCPRIYRGYGKNSRDVVSRWIRALLAGEQITVFRPEGMFDYIYAKDSAEGLVRLAYSDTVTGIVNLGTGHARRVQDVIDILRSHFPDMRVVSEPSEIPFEASQADITALRDAIGWVPQYTLDTAIPEIIAFERSRSGVDQVTPQRGHVMITSAAGKAPLVRAMLSAANKLHPDIKVWAGDVDEHASSRHVADGFWKMPRTADTELEALLAGCKERGIWVLLPTRDGELEFWARHRERFADEGIDVVVGPIDSVTTCLDKLAFAGFGLANGLPFIETGLSPDELGPGPYVVKERYGAGSRQIGLRLDRESAMEHARSLEHPIYQPFVAGREISIDAWLDKAQRVKGLVLRTRDRVVNGESQVTTTFRHPEIESIATRALEALKLRGPVVMQALIDPDQRLHIIECNSRFGGASTASIAAGLDMLYWSLLEAQGADMGQVPFDRIQGDVRQVRVPTDIVIHDPDL